MWAPFLGWALASLHPIAINRSAGRSAVEQVIEERSRLLTAIAEFDFVLKVWPSQANFFLVRVRNAVQLMEHCAAHKVLLRHFGGDLSDCIRITVGSPSDNNTLLDALNRFGKG